MRILFAAAALIALAAPVHASVEEQRRILAVFAHPDDEVVVAPVLARLAREGASVSVVYATSGDQGTGVSGLDAGDALAALREGEARCAARELGIAEPTFLRLGDATLGVRAHDADSPAERFIAGLRKAIEAHQPDLVLTWGPDGGYGHADHRIVSALTTEVVQAMGEGRPQLLYPGIRAGTLPDRPEMASWAVTAPELLPIAEPYQPGDREAAHRGVGCHQSQFDAETRAGLVPLFDATIWQGAVHLRPAFASTVINAPAKAVPGEK